MAWMARQWLHILQSDWSCQYDAWPSRYIKRALWLAVHCWAIRRAYKAWIASTSWWICSTRSSSASTGERFLHLTRWDRRYNLLRAIYGNTINTLRPRSTGCFSFLPLVLLSLALFNQRFSKLPYRVIPSASWLGKLQSVITFHEYIYTRSIFCHIAYRFKRVAKVGVSDNLFHLRFSRRNRPTKIKLNLTLKPRGHADKELLQWLTLYSHYKLVKIANYSPTLQCNDCQQLGSAIADVLLQALGLDEGCKFELYTDMTSQ